MNKDIQNDLKREVWFIVISGTLESKLTAVHTYIHTLNNSCHLTYLTYTGNNRVSNRENKIHKIINILKVLLRNNLYCLHSNSKNRTRSSSCICLASC